MKRRIFTTYADSPIKNIKTPIRKINFATGEDEVQITTPTIVQAANPPSMDMLQRIHTLLIVVIVIQLICLFIKK